MNANDRDNRGRSNKRAGENHGSAKLSKEDILKIRVLDENGVKHSDIAKQYPVCREVISRICRRKLWGHVA